MKRFAKVLVLAALCGAVAQAADSPSAPKELSERFQSPYKVVKVDADAGIQAGDRKDLNLGRNDIVEVKDYDDTPDWGWVLQKVYLRFPLEGLNPESLDKAYLCLYGNLGDGDKPVKVDVYVLADKDENWGEETITWNNAPKPQSTEPVASVDITFISDEKNRRTDGLWGISGDIASVLKDKMARGAKSVSFLLSTPIKEEACIFTKEHPDGAERSPRLVVIEKK